MCDCGCNTCDNTKISLNESLIPKQLAPEILSEGLNYHLENNIPLYENIYQYGSEKYFTLLNEARKLYSRGMLDLNEEDEDLIRTNIGAFGMYEGKRVPLDFPMLDEDLDLNEAPTEEEIIDDILSELNNLQEIDFNKVKEKIKSYAKKGLLTLSILLAVTNSLQASNPQLAQDVLKTSIEMVDSNQKTDFYSAVIGLTQKYLSSSIEKGDIDHAGYLKEVKLHYENLRDGGKGNNLSPGAKVAEKVILKTLSKMGVEKAISFAQAGKDIKTKLEEQKEYTQGDFEQMASREFKPGTATNSDIVALARKAFLDYKFGRGFKQYFPKTFNTSEAKKKKDTKKKPIGKPMRDSSGGSAYKVYVKDPKTGNIKTVRFGSGGLKAKINNSKARAAFAKRHKCSQKKDRTKASYWSCRLPRYAKLLGLKSSFSGFW